MHYKYLVVAPKYEGSPYHDDYFEEEVLFLVPPYMKNLLGDFRVFNDWDYADIDEVLIQLVPIFNHIQARLIGKHHE